MLGVEVEVRVLWSWGIQGPVRSEVQEKYDCWDSMVGFGRLSIILALVLLRCKEERCPLMRYTVLEPAE